MKELVKVSGRLILEANKATGEDRETLAGDEEYLNGEEK